MTAFAPDWTLRVRDLAIARGGLPVLEGLDFALTAGQALILRGPNGVGKTTLLRTLAGLQPAISGRVEMPEDCLTYAAHADGLKPALSARENLGFWAAIHGRDGVGPALAALDLAALANRRAGDLSAGQKRRLGLARLLVTGRWLWLLDEPTVSLDQSSVTLFAGVVRAHLAAGGAAVLATHTDLALPEARVLDLTPFRARLGAAPKGKGFDEVFG